MNVEHRTFTEIRGALSDHLSLIFENEGYSPLVGKIFAMLLFAPEPLSLQELAGLLGVSKAAVSVQIRAMGRNALCHKIHKGNDRKDYYYISEDISLKVIQSVSQKLLAGQQLISKTLEAISRLEQVEPGDQASREIARKRMTEMSDMYELSRCRLQGLQSEWEHRFRTRQ
ncbi:GbsR/MarR family transcriptional regulator [Paenibacillus rigui]|uniref:HTH marR-type domain-containing protein n=1 Tax=Paenibacillus rigui TaxID=554312 RepID=A0A229UUH7_9BACL|nr:hypothetical protein [Paenibacillus rigui]OXM87257.1 hypothetical protein CF651_06350 [Paenibacillus rigui]